MKKFMNRRIKKQYAHYNLCHTHCQLLVKQNMNIKNYFSLLALILLMQIV